MKKDYQKPMMQVYPFLYGQYLLAGSGSPRLNQRRSVTLQDYEEQDCDDEW